MAWRGNRNRGLILWLIGAHIYIFSSLSPAFADQESTGLPWSFLKEHRTQILQLASDDEALTFFTSTIHREAKGSRINKKSPSAPTQLNLPAEIIETIISYLKSLAVSNHAQLFREILVKPTTGIPPLSDVIPGEAHLQWIMTHSTLQGLKPIIDGYRQVSAWSHMTTSQPDPPDEEFAKFASYYDQTYQEWDESPQSWTSLFTQHGQKGIENRLLEYWQTSNHPANTHQPFLPIQDAYTQHYIETRLLPMFRMNLLTKTSELEATAYGKAWEGWQKIQQWQQQEQTNSASTRLCGTWRWIVHNHQNHGDRKMTVTFSPPDQSSPSQIAPSAIEIHGDTVYLKWTFPQGVQEDSLLLSNNDSHLEGTFKNSLGPYGSISGKRLSTCQP
ncbi:hypothetical protein [Candidatus Nitrospira neomarina]|uniref:Uncharacterized protein n=1 Tax=Candidatus Nitrospira neomarina TaxID=3020899 RepID=A0AA96GQZ4_9BACT|nr:hypothetical protein [Candidatus Nitrospira neomarina]WNM63723.1 hypothetical protein PQG83_08210 [Candidatus Nitrospira neomarina]